MAQVLTPPNDEDRITPFQVVVVTLVLLAAILGVIAADRGGRTPPPRDAQAAAGPAIVPVPGRRAQPPTRTGGTSTRANTGTTTNRNQQPQATTVVTSPPRNCGADATATLQRLINGARNGSTVSLLAGHCYHVDGTLLVSGRTNLVIDGNGATLRAFSQGTRNRMFWKILSSSHVTIKDMTMWGPNTSGRYNAALEAQHGVSVNGSTDAVVSNITVRNVYGDGVQVTKAGDGSPAGSDRVTIRNSRFQTIGRQGITITKARNVTVDGNTFNDVARSVIDLEPPTDTWYAEHVTIENNVTGDYGNMFVAGGGHGCNMHDIVIRGNVSKGGGIAIGVPGDTCHKSGVLVENNTFHLMVGADKGHWANFWRVDDVTIRGNRILTSRTIPGVHFIESQGTLIVQGNTFSGTCTAVDADDSAPVQESDNTLSSSCP